MTVAEVMKKIHITRDLICKYENLCLTEPTNGEYDNVLTILHDHLEMLRNMKVKEI